MQIVSVGNQLTVRLLLAMVSKVLLALFAVLVVVQIVHSVPYDEGKLELTD